MTWWLGSALRQAGRPAEGDRVRVEICRGPFHEARWLTITHVAEHAYRGVIDDKGSTLVKQLKKGAAIDFRAQHVMENQGRPRVSSGVQQELFG